MVFKGFFLLSLIILVLILMGYAYIEAEKELELSVNEFDKKYESEDILNFVINKELQSIEYKENENSILIPISEVKSYEFRVEERSNEYESFRKA